MISNSPATFFPELPIARNSSLANGFSEALLGRTQPSSQNFTCYSLLLSFGTKKGFSILSFDLQTPPSTMSPRRSSRARTSQPSPALPQHTNSSSSSSNSHTRERSTRSNHKNASPYGSSGHRSQSIDDVESGSKDLPQTRQRQRAHDDDDPREEDDEDLDEEEEITRCLCAQQDYPGLPPSRREALGRGTIKLESLQGPLDPSDPLSDEIGSMFIQCDLCKVWQHGGCVGIMDESTSPDEYFCEECRKDLHKIKEELNG